ncbi:MAG: PQQ-dependent sugar dehydrogenase [Planctomycetes bacterium]|nr:PQQ-dependent sugar dehydrogenase [Planctomycetota bacterium]
MPKLSLVSVGLALAAQLAGQAIPDLQLANAFPEQNRFQNPLLVEFVGSDPEHAYVVEQRGRIWRIPRDSDADTREPFLDLGETVFHPWVDGHPEEGLLGFAFDPSFAENNHVWVYYSEKTGEGEPYIDKKGKRRIPYFRRSVIARLTADDAGRSVDPGTELRILELTQPWGNHNGGTILFGPDDMLYIALGDGGHRADRGGNGQNLSTLLGSILRIDVRTSTDETPYAIPDDNPFVDREGARGEIWAYGLRNPWRISFDRETGELWCGDVGQDTWEEVDRIVKGGNYGWPLREGTHGFPPERDDSEDPREKFVDPVHDYGRDYGISVTGGHVYRGAAIPELRGYYVFGDFATGRISAVEEDREKGEHVVVDLDLRRPGLLSFGETPEGELLVLSGDGRIYRLEKAPD